MGDRLLSPRSATEPQPHTDGPAGLPHLDRTGVLAGEVIVTLDQAKLNAFNSQLDRLGESLRDCGRVGLAEQLDRARTRFMSALESPDNGCAGNSERAAAATDLQRIIDRSQRPDPLQSAEWHRLEADVSQFGVDLIAKGCMRNAAAVRETFVGLRDVLANPESTQEQIDRARAQLTSTLEEAGRALEPAARITTHLGRASNPHSNRIASYEISVPADQHVEFEYVRRAQYGEAVQQQGPWRGYVYSGRMSATEGVQPPQFGGHSPSLLVTSRLSEDGTRRIYAIETCMAFRVDDLVLVRVGTNQPTPIAWGRTPEQPEPRIPVEVPRFPIPTLDHPIEVPALPTLRTTTRIPERPLDLAIPNPKPLQPLDCAVPNPKPLQPLDLAIPNPKPLRPIRPLPQLPFIIRDPNRSEP